MEVDLQEKRDQDRHGSEAPEGALGKASAKALAIRLANLPATELNAILDRTIERYGDGVSIYAIANELGIKHTTLYRQLVKHRETEWRDAKVSRALAELEDAEEALKSPKDGLALTCARERCRAAQWQLERLYRRIYGQDQVAQSVVPIQINIGISRRDQVVTYTNQPVTSDS